MKHAYTAHVGNTTYTIKEDASGIPGGMARIRRVNQDGETLLYVPKSIIVDFAREQIIRGMIDTFLDG